MSVIDTVLEGLPLSLSLDWSGQYTAEVSAGKREKIATLYRISPTSQIQVVTYHYNDPEKPLHHVEREYWVDTPAAAHKVMEDFLLG